MILRSPPCAFQKKPQSRRGGKKLYNTQYLLRGVLNILRITGKNLPEMEMIEVGYAAAAMMEDQGCSTPKRRECQILAAVCPPAPKKKKPFSYEKKRELPKNGYFQPPDLELIFTMAPRRQACA